MESPEEKSETAESIREDLESAVREALDLSKSGWMRIVIPYAMPQPDLDTSYPAWEMAVVGAPWDRFVGILKTEGAAGPRKLRELLGFLQDEEKGLNVLYGHKKDELNDMREHLDFSYMDEMDVDEATKVAAIEQSHYDDWVLARATIAERREIGEQAEVVSFLASVIRNVLWRYTAYGEQKRWAKISEETRSAILMRPSRTPSTDALNVARAFVQVYDQRIALEKPVHLIGELADLVVEQGVEGVSPTTTAGSLTRTVQRAVTAAGLPWPAVSGMKKTEVLPDKIDVIRRMVTMFSVAATEENSGGERDKPSS